jgi:uncharacterized protein (DUF427 family)
MTAATAVQQGPARREPAHTISFEPCAKRVRVQFNGETVADSTRVHLLHETRHLPVYYFPRADVRMELLTRTDHATHCPYKGDASYWTVTVGERSAENAVWSYEDPIPEVAGIKDCMAFYWERMDRWLEEDEEVIVHARDPRVRIDVLESHRPVTVTLGGVTVAETRRARFLFETNLPTRYYIPREDVRLDLLEPSDSHTACPYKGRASYYSARIGGTLYPDIAWFYPDPLPESLRIKDYLCFYDEQVDAVTLDGEVQPRPQTKWSKKD